MEKLIICLLILIAACDSPKHEQKNTNTIRLDNKMICLDTYITTDSVRVQYLLDSIFLEHPTDSEYMGSPISIVFNHQKEIVKIFYGFETADMNLADSFTDTIQNIKFYDDKFLHIIKQLDYEIISTNDTFWCICEEKEEQISVAFPKIRFSEYKQRYHLAILNYEYINRKATYFHIRKSELQSNNRRLISP